MDANEMRYRLTVAAYARQMGHDVPEDSHAGNVEVTSRIDYPVINDGEDPERELVNSLQFTPTRIVPGLNNWPTEVRAGNDVWMSPFDLADFTQFVTEQAIAPKPEPTVAKIVGCTELTAGTCPICGECCCTSDVNIDPECDLHGDESMHGTW